MANPTTLIDYNTQLNSNLTAALTAAQTNLTTKLAAATAASATLSTLQTQLAAIVADMASLRTQLAAAVTPEDGAALLAKLQTDISSWRQTTGQIAWAERAVTIATADANGATAEAQRLTAALAASTTALANAQTAATQRATFTTLLAAPPLATIVTDANNVLSSTVTVDAGGKFKLSDAVARLQADLPLSMITESEVRLTDEIARAKASGGEALQAETELEAQWTSDGGAQGAVNALQNAYTRAWAALNEYITTAGDRFTMAKTAIATVADKTVSPLTAAQVTAIQDATTVSNAVAGAALEKPVDDQVAAVAVAQQNLDDAVRQAIAKHNDPATDPGVAAAQTALNTAQTQLTTVKSAYTAVPAAPPGAQSAQQEMVAWQVRVPDSEWQLLWSYEKAKITLNWLTTPGPVTLTNNLNTAEANLVAQLLISDASIAAGAALRAEATKRAAIAAYEQQAADSRRFSALRGDF